MIEDSLHRLAVIGAVGSHRRPGLLAARLITRRLPISLAPAAIPLAGRLPALGSPGCTAGPLRGVPLAGLLTTATIPGIGLSAVELLAAAALPFGPAARSRATGSALFPALSLRRTPLLVVPRLRLRATLTAAAGGAPLLPRLRIALLAVFLLAVFLLWFGLLRLLRPVAARSLSVGRLLLLTASLTTVRLLHRAFAVIPAALPLRVFTLATALPAWVAGCSSLIRRRLCGLLSTASVAILRFPFARTRRHLFRRPRRCRGIDLQQFPGGVRHVRLIGPRVHGHAPILERAPRPRPETLRHQLHRALERGPALAAGQHDLRLCRTALDPCLDADSGEAEIRIDRPHPHGHGCPRRHPSRRFLRLLDRDFRRQIGLHLDPMFEFLRLHLLLSDERRAARLEEQPIGAVLRGRPLRVHLQHERATRPGQVTRPDLELEIAVSIASEIDPCRLERLVALGDDHDTRALDRPEITLPRHRLALAARVGRKLVPHLAHEKRRRVDHRHADGLAPRIAGMHGEYHRLIQPAGRIGQHGRIPLPVAHLAADPRHLDTPRHGRSVDGAAVEQRRHGDHRSLVAPQASDRTAHHQLPTANQRAPAHIDRDAPGIVRIHAGGITGGRLLPGHPPPQVRRRELHPRGRRHAGPRRQQPCCGREHALR